MEEIKFAVDSMLGKLARYLRILGYDTLYLSDDDYLLKKCLEENRVLITRDKELYNRARGLSLRCLLIRSNDLHEQLFEVYNIYGLERKRPRCPLCNGELKNISKNLIKDKVPRKVYERNETFLICNNCKKIYWYGKHWDEINKILNKIFQNY